MFLKVVDPRRNFSNFVEYSWITSFLFTKVVQKLKKMGIILYFFHFTSFFEISVSFFVEEGDRMTSSMGGRDSGITNFLQAIFLRRRFSNFVKFLWMTSFLFAKCGKQKSENILVFFISNTFLENPFSCQVFEIVSSFFSDLFVWEHRDNFVPPVFQLRKPQLNISAQFQNAWYFWKFLTFLKFLSPFNFFSLASSSASPPSKPEKVK